MYFFVFEDQAELHLANEYYRMFFPYKQTRTSLNKKNMNTHFL